MPAAVLPAKQVHTPVPPPKVVAVSVLLRGTDGSVLEGFLLKGSYSGCHGNELGGGTGGWLKPAGHMGTPSGLDFILIVRGQHLVLKSSRLQRIIIQTAV